MLIPFILEKALSLYHNREAVVSVDKRFTYKEFADRVYRLANALGSMNSLKGDRIAILHENSHEFLETYFAVAQLGCILVPINVRLSPKEIAFIINDSGAHTLIASRRFREQVNLLIDKESCQVRLILTGEENINDSTESYYYEKMLREHGNTPPAVPDLSDDETAHIYYTSGTTGRPKGVMLSHKNVCIHSLAAIG